MADAMRDVTSKFLALTAALLVMALARFVFKRRHQHKTFERMGVPGPKPNFIHGSLYDTRRQTYVKFAHQMHEKYGKTVGMFMGGDPYLMTKDLDLIQQVFVAKSRIFYDRMNFYLNIDPVPDNLICQRGDRWRYMRKLLTPAFSNSKIKSSNFYRDTQQTVAKFKSQLEANSSPGERRETFVEDVYDRMAAVALDVIVKTAFHMDNVISFAGRLSQSGPQARGPKPCAGQAERPQQDSFLSMAKTACKLAFNPLVELIFCFPFLDKPLTFLGNQIYLGAIINFLMQRLEYLVKRAEFPESATEPEGPIGRPLEASVEGDKFEPERRVADSVHRRRIIDTLIEVLRERKITRSEFTGNAFVIVFAGFETTANALTFTLWLLAKHQHVQRKLRAQLRARMEELAKRGDRSSEDEQADWPDSKTATDYELGELASGCEYLEMVINESLRLYPPVPALSCRQASVDCTMANGLNIEKGVIVIPSVFSIHRDRSIWGDEASEFKPERFELLDVTKVNSAMFMPFGLGPRNCIGKAAAMHELKIVIGRLILDYSVEMCPGKTPEKLKLCSPINITITNSEKIGLNFVKLSKAEEQT